MPVAAWGLALFDGRDFRSQARGNFGGVNSVGHDGKSNNSTRHREDWLTQIHELKMSGVTLLEFAMTLENLAALYQTNNGGHSVLRIGPQVLALAMTLEENCQAPEEGADQGEFWCSAGPLRDMDNEALANSQNAFEVWVRPPGINSNYEQRGRFEVSGLIDNQQALDEARQMRESEDPVVRIIQIQRVAGGLISLAI